MRTMTSVAFLRAWSTEKSVSPWVPRLTRFERPKVRVWTTKTLLAGGVHSDAEAGKPVVPEDGVLAVDRETVHGAPGEGAVPALRHGAGAACDDG